MKRYLMYGVLIFLITFWSMPAWSSGKAEKAEGQQDSVYVIRNQDGQHVQLLGGKSGCAFRGLARAAERSRFMEILDPSKKPKLKPKDEADKVVRKKK